MKKKKLIKNTLIMLGVTVGCYYTYKGWYIYFREPPIGNNNWRSYYRKDGKPKIYFENNNKAAMVALQMISKYGEPFDSYQCSDGKFRIGHAFRLSNMPFVAIDCIKRVIKNICI